MTQGVGPEFKPPVPQKRIKESHPRANSFQDPISKKTQYEKGLAEWLKQ
jgi:hypothetical protein